MNVCATTGPTKPACCAMPIACSSFERAVSMSSPWYASSACPFNSPICASTCAAARLATQTWQAEPDQSAPPRSAGAVPIEAPPRSAGAVPIEAPPRSAGAVPRINARESFASVPSSCWPNLKPYLSAQGTSICATALDHCPHGCERTLGCTRSGQLRRALHVPPSYASDTGTESIDERAANRLIDVGKRVRLDLADWRATSSDAVPWRCASASNTSLPAATMPNTRRAASGSYSTSLASQEVERLRQLRTQRDADAVKRRVLRGEAPRSRVAVDGDDPRAPARAAAMRDDRRARAEIDHDACRRRAPDDRARGARALGRSPSRTPSTARNHPRAAPDSAHSDPRALPPATSAAPARAAATEREVVAEHLRRGGFVLANHRSAAARLRDLTLIAGEHVSGVEAHGAIQAVGHSRVSVQAFAHRSAMQRAFGSRAWHCVSDMQLSVHTLLGQMRPVSQSCSRCTLRRTCRVRRAASAAREQR